MKNEGKPSGTVQCSTSSWLQLLVGISKKGGQVFVEGRLKTRKWQDRSGVERFTTRIEANELTMLGGKSGEVRQPVEAEEFKDFTSIISEAKTSAVPLGLAFAR